MFSKKKTRREKFRELLSFNFARAYSSKPLLFISTLLLALVPTVATARLLYDVLFGDFVGSLPLEVVLFSLQGVSLCSLLMYAKAVLKRSSMEFWRHIVLFMLYGSLVIMTSGIGLLPR